MSRVMTYFIVDAAELDTEQTFELAVKTAWLSVRRAIKAQGNFDYVSVALSATGRNSGDLEKPQ